jgi:dienelactone hydrolase
MQRRTYWLPVALGLLLANPVSSAERLPGTKPLALPENVVAVHQQQVVDYFLRRIAEAEKLRDAAWKPDFASEQSYEKSVASHRGRCRAMLGLSSEPVPLAAARTELLGKSADIRVERLSLPVQEGVLARGLLWVPEKSGRKAVVIVCGDANAWPEKMADSPEGSDLLAGLLARGAIVYQPQSIERLADHAYCKTLRGFDRRKILYRLGYIVGRTMTGIDVQETVAAIDWLSARSDVDAARIGLAGMGQGGMTALYTVAIDPRIRCAAVADYFQRRDRVFEEPVDRRLPGQLLEFGDAEMAALVAPRQLAIVNGAPSPTVRDRLTSEFRRAARFYEGLRSGHCLQMVAEPGGVPSLSRPAGIVAEALRLPRAQAGIVLPALGVGPDAALAVRDQHFRERVHWLRRLIDASQAKRYQRWGLLTRTATDFANVKAEMLADYRRLVGVVPTAGTPSHPRSELALVTDKYQAYRVMLDVTEGVEVYGNLLVPRTIPGRAAAVICQHGLNGMPEEITGLGQKVDTCYHEFGRRLAERGYVVFAPLITHHYLPSSKPDPAGVMNRLAWQADTVGMMRVAMVAAKTNRVIDFLQSLPFVDGKHIGYYGLSYGGYSAIWCAPLVERIVATVISGNFNDRRAKLTSDAEATSYLLHPYEDMYYWDLLHRCTDPEQILMTAPRAVCIEFGQKDSITTPAWTAAAWKQTTTLCDRFGLRDRVELVHFDGPHEIHGIGTFDFLDRFLRPADPVRKSRLGSN